MENAHPCPLCRSTNTSLFWRGQNPTRDYFECDACELVFVPREFHLSPAQEKAIYDQHENNPNDPRYRKFLNRIFEPMKRRLMPSSSGLDFGSGPGPTLSLMFREAGFSCLEYDKFYAPNASLLEAKYDFITCTEVFEHLDTPNETIHFLFEALRENAYLGVMTKLLTSEQSFEHWHYKNDPTHICFYRPKTMETIAQQYDWKVDIISNDVILFSKN